MRLLGCVSLLTLGLGGLGVAGCDDAKSPAVNEDIGWKVGCAAGSMGCTAFRYHNQTTMTVERDFEVSCKVSGDAVSFTINDPGIDELKMPPGWPAGVISVQNGNTAQNACNVTVQDRQEPGYAPITIRGTCQASGGLGGCTLTRMPAGPMTKGWDWVGTLSCDKMERDSMPMPQYSLGALAGGPITIALANCD